MPHQPLFRKIFDSELHDIGTADKLRRITEQYPYFSLAHFFSLKNATVNDVATPEQMQMAALHFNNLFLLNKRISETLENKDFDMRGYDAEMRKESISSEDSSSNITSPIETIITSGTDDFFHAAGDEPETFNKENKLQAEVNTEVQEHEAEAPLPTIEPVTENEDIKENALATPEIAENVDTNAQLTNKEDLGESATPSSNTENDFAKENEISVLPTSHAYVDSIPHPATEEETPDATIVTNTSENTNIDQEEKPLFEPLHTTDYFASQGIRISDEIKNAEESKEMKSFTNWLRSMKRLNQAYTHDQDRPIDPQVEKLARSSNEEQNIVTESMAETFLSQGKHEKAKEIYRQLSLQNPSKSGYFAALLEKIV